MSLLAYLILLVVTGLVVGALGRLALPGPDPMSIGQTIFVGIGGNLIAGLVAWAIFGHNGAGLILSVAAATGIVYLIRRSQGRGLGSGPPQGRLP